MQDTQLTLQMVLERAASLYGGSAVTTKTAGGVRRRSFTEVVERTTRLAAALRQLGVRPGDRVATFGWNSDRHLELYLAVPCMGAVLHTLNLRLPHHQVAWIAAHAGDSVVFVDRSVAPLWAAVGDVPGVRQVVVMDDVGAGGGGGSGDAAGGGEASDALLDGALDYEELIAGAAASYPWPRLDERDAAAMCYSSGTTGDPKGVVYSHRSSMLHAMALLFADAMAIGERDVVLPIVPQFHVNAWGTPYAAVMTGADLAMPARFLDPESVVALVEQTRTTISAAVPTVWFGVAQAIRAGTVDPARLASLERIIVGGSAVPEALVRAFDDIGITMIHAWGMTETSPLGTVARVKATVPEDRVFATRLTQGLPAPSLRVRVTTVDGEVAARDGETMGELEITGPWIADAYYDPSAPGLRGGEDRFATDDAGDRWLRTGDVATIDAEGYVQLVDRVKDLVKSGGEWISTVELENLLMAHPGVTEAAVIAVPSERWDERPLACVVRSDDALTSEELIAHLAGHVAKWQLPDEVVFVDEVPKTSVGKFDKKVLRGRFATEVRP